MNNDKNLKINFSFLQILYWCTYGSFTTFAISFFIDSGLSTSSAGICASIYALGSFIGQMFFSQVSDRLKTNKKIFIIGMILTIAMYFIIFYAPKQSGIIIILFGLLGFVQNPTLTSMDTWILKTYYKTPEIYGPIRSSASLLYAFFMIFYGGLITKNGYVTMLFSSVIFATLAIIVAFLTPDSPQSSQKKEKVFIKTLIQNKSFIFVLFIAFMIGLSSSPLMNMIGVIIKTVDGSLKDQGLALFASSISQVPFMMMSIKIANISVYKRLSVAAISYIICLFIMSFATTPSLIIIGSVFNGIGFGIAIPTLKQAAFENSPKNLQTTAQGLVESFQSSVAGILSTLASGIVMQNYGLKTFMMVCIAIEVCLFLVLCKKIFIQKKLKSVKI